MPKKWELYEEGSEVDPSGGKILLIRHGESEAYVNTAATHSREVHLTPRGREQAAEIAKRFVSAPDRIISSPYLRAWETSEPTRQRFLDTPCECLDAWEFTYLGSLEGVLCTMQERRTLVESYWEWCDPTYRDGNGESFEMLIARVQRVLGEIWKQSGSAAIFAHEQFIIAARGVLEGRISPIPTRDEMQGFRKRLLQKELSLPYGQIWEVPAELDERNKHPLTIPVQFDEMEPLQREPAFVG